MMLLAHTGRPLAPHDLAAAWSFDGAVIAALCASALLYAFGLHRIRRRVGADRGVRDVQALAFCAGWLVLVVALVSPLHALGSVLFSAHMVQHELLIILAAPLLVLGRPMITALWALPLQWRRQAGRVARHTAARRAWYALTAPLAAWLLHAAALWLWHLPAPYQATLRSELMHSLQHVSFLATALLFWWSLIGGRHRRLGYGAALFYVFTTAVHSSALGVLLTFADAPWYSAYATTSAWGLTALADQQLAGLIMWVPAGAAYLVAALLLLRAWLAEAERRVVRWQTRTMAARG